ncbi:noncompact myelin-associated protein isoform X2 [Diceros bicornis minor]|uniref:noncompact myelin-associated protein isoform X2 n=1 Tax=Diceros bicornis minor TaxID=77932 RepID=UPI0026EEEEFF|nr:noncompact myelin-associated protein isoform X2 [Diceros bicornis minor]
MLEPESQKGPRSGRGTRTPRGGAAAPVSRLWRPRRAAPRGRGTEGASSAPPRNHLRRAGRGRGRGPRRPEPGGCGGAGWRLSGRRPARGARPGRIEMTTATPLGGTTFFSLNMTTRGEDFLYKSSGAIVAAIVVVVIIIFTVVLILLKIYNRKMRTRRELEPKAPKPASPSALDPNSNSSQHPATVTFSPVDVHVETR